MNLSHNSSSMHWTIASQVSWEAHLYHLIYRFVYSYKMFYSSHPVAVKSLFSISLRDGGWIYILNRKTWLKEI
jgi:hypothetical protein